MGSVASSHVLAHDEVAQRIKELEERLRAMQSGMQAMQNELENLKTQSSQVTEKVERIQQDSQVAGKVKKIPEKEIFVEANQVDGNKSNMVFFRGGYAHSSQHRDGMVFHSDVVPAGAQDRPDKNGWYFGAGFDWNLTKNAWGLASKTNVLAELMLSTKNLAHVCRAMH